MNQGTPTPKGSPFQRLLAQIGYTQAELEGDPRLRNLFQYKLGLDAEITAIGKDAICTAERIDRVLHRFGLSPDDLAADKRLGYLVKGVINAKLRLACLKPKAKPEPTKEEKPLCFLTK